MERDGDFCPCSLGLALCLKDDWIFSSEFHNDPFEHLDGQTFMEHLNSFILKITVLGSGPHVKESHRFISHYKSISLYRL